MYASYCLYFAGNPLPAIQVPGKSGAASVWYMEQWFKNMKLWTTAPTKAEPGDLVIYRFSHIGIVEGVDAKGRRLAVWEGNTDTKGGRTGGRVLRQMRSFSLIKGICKVPNYVPEVPNAPVPAPVKNVPAWPGRYILLTTPQMKGSDVMRLQEKMNQWGSKLQLDGIFGKASSDAVRWWQGVMGLSIDGVVGPQTWTVFFNH
jgi:hypothetical protein